MNAKFQFVKLTLFMLEINKTTETTPTLAHIDYDCY